MKNIIMLIFALLVTQTAFGQFKSAGQQYHTVQQILDNAVRYSFSDKTVHLQGNIVEHIKEDYYLFKDNTGEIRVEIYQHRMPDARFNESDQVILSGEVDLRFMKPEIYVTSIRLKQPDSK